MPRWLLSLLAIIPFSALVVIAFLPVYIIYGVYKLHHPAFQVLCLVYGFVVMVIGCFMIARLINRFEARKQAVDAEQWRAELEVELAKLRDDPTRAHWAPLARNYYRVDRDQIERWERRYRQLQADPRRNGYAARCLSGHFFADQQIDYELDPTMLVTCEHLRAVERELRALPGSRCSRIVLDDQIESRRIFTDVLLRSDDIRARFQLPDFVEWYVEPYHPHSSEEESFECRRCGSAIVGGRGPVTFP